MRRLNTVLNEDTINKIITDYQDGMNYKAVCKKYDIGRERLLNILNEFGIHVRTIQDANGKIIPEEIEEQIIAKYINKNSVYSLVKEFKLSQDKIESILKKNGVELRNYTEAKQLGRKYIPNDNYFKVQSHNMAYILGLLAADGNISKKENNIAIQLLSKDEELLQRIAEETETKKPIDRYITSTGKETSKWSVSSKIWKQDLAIYGIVPNKTFALKPPTFLNSKFYIDYIKGYFDGDGSVSIRKDTNHLIFSIAGVSKEVIEWMRMVLINQYGIKVSNINAYSTDNGKIMYRFTITSKLGTRQIYDLFYNSNNSNLCLNRKYQIFYNYFHETSLPKIDG